MTKTQRSSDKSCGEKEKEENWGKRINLTTAMSKKGNISEVLDKGLDTKLLHLSQLPYWVENIFSKFFCIYLLHSPGIVYGLNCILKILICQSTRESIYRTQEKHSNFQCMQLRGCGGCSFVL